MRVFSPYSPTSTPWANSPPIDLERWFGLLDYRFTHSSTIGGALREICEEGALMVPGATAGVDREGDRHILWLQIKRFPWIDHRLAEEFIIASIVSRGRLALGSRLKIDRIALTTRPPVEADEEAVRTFFDAPVLFGAERAEIVLLVRIWESESRPAFAAVFEALRALAKQPQVTAPGDYDIIRQTLTSLVEEQNISLGMLAKRLHTSIRTLQRRLSQLGTTFSDMLNDVRLERAKHYLINSDRQIGEIAYLLGFSEPASFYRTFKRSAGVSPAIYRRSRQAQHREPSQDGGQGSSIGIVGQ